MVREFFCVDKIISGFTINSPIVCFNSYNYNRSFKKSCKKSRFDKSYAFDQVEDVIITECYVTQTFTTATQSLPLGHKVIFMPGGLGGNMELARFSLISSA